MSRVKMAVCYWSMKRSKLTIVFWENDALRGKFKFQKGILPYPTLLPGTSKQQINQGQGCGLELLRWDKGPQS